MNGLPYYKAYPRDFIEGTIGMPFEAKCGYRVVLDLIYMQGGSLPDDSRYISGLLGCSVRKWSSLRQTQLDLGKIDAENGVISNKRARNELETLAKVQDKQRQNRSRPNKNNALPSPWSDHTEPEPEYTLAKANDGGAVDAVDELWSKHREWLISQQVPDRQARSLIGKWLKDRSPEDVRAAFLDAYHAKTGDPVPYITEILKPQLSQAEETRRIFAEAGR